MSKVKKFLRELDKHMDKAAKMVTPHPEYKAVLKCLMVLLVLSILAKALCRSRLGRLPVMRQLCGAGSKGVIYVRRVGDSTANVLAHPVASARRVIRHPVQAADAEFAGYTLINTLAKLEADQLLAESTEFF